MVIHLVLIPSVIPPTDLMFLALQIILALGNRPKAEKLTYTVSICVFAFFALYLIFMTVILTIKAFCVSPLSGRSKLRAARADLDCFW